MLKIKQRIILTSILGILLACANNNQEGNTHQTVQHFESRIIAPVTTFPKQNESKVMYDYSLYQTALISLKQKQTEDAYHFLSFQTGQQNSMVEQIRIGLLKILGKQANWAEFLSQYKLLPSNTNNLEVNCYATIAGYSQRGISLSNMSGELVKSNEKLPEGCNKMIEVAASRGMIDQNDVWRRVRILISNNYITLAKNLANAVGQPIPNISVYDGSKASKIAKIMPGITPKGRNRHDIDEFIYKLYGNVDQDDIGFVEGLVGLSKARDLDMVSALQHFNKSDKTQLSNEQWEWYARSALRLKLWSQLSQIIQMMPKKLRETPTWWYWQGRAKAALGDRTNARILYEKVVASGRNFYAILGHEELGKPLNVKSNTSGGRSSSAMALAQDSQIHRSLVLFRNSLDMGDRQMRIAAQDQWRYAIKNFADDKLILASQLALQNQFYEMSILSADMSDSLLDYQLRFPFPYKNIVEKYTDLYGIESAWVFGLIRQESRFIMIAKSSVGASGLMQIMPGTAQVIARKIGLDGYHLLNNMDNNINMGVWYLADLYKQFNSEPLATSAYNAGPGRAKRWRQNGLEGAVYVETIPFDETREYVKKVMSNTVYYSHLFSGFSNKSLKARLGFM
ncbi:MAG: transglycosylase SLT domain-containing protein [Neisseriaceae bacterium]|nr:MAG: transglycosylase SLT domain-containing protein [Neisseriaceae bacterium]